MLGTITSQFTQSVAKNNPRWENIVAIGDTYARGKYPFLKPNSEMATMCYNVAEGCPSPRVQSTARSRILEMVANPVEVADTKGSEMSTQYGKSACKAAVRFVREVKPPPRKVSLKVRAQPPPMPHHPLQVVQAHIVPRGQQTAGRRDGRRDGRRRRTRRCGNAIDGGSQNTHDHGVASATKSNIRQLRHSRGTKAFRGHTEVVDETMDICRKVVDDPNSMGVSEETYNDVYEVATSLTNDLYSDTGLSQVQILDMTLDKIKSLEVAVAKGVTETLCKRMATGVEDGKTVCATGKIARIVSVFEGVLDDTQKAVSIAYVEKEIAQMAVTVRDEFLDRVGPIAKMAYESQQSVPEYGASMAGILKERVTREYIDKLNMSPSVIDPLVKLYSLAF